MKILFDRKGDRPCRAWEGLVGLWFSLILLLTPAVITGSALRVYANGDHSGGHVKETKEVFNPTAFAIVSGGIVVVGYFLYRIFSGGGKKKEDRGEEG